jgi:hypothetical protein
MVARSIDVEESRGEGNPKHSPRWLDLWECERSPRSIGRDGRSKTKRGTMYRAPAQKQKKQ